MGSLGEGTATPILTRRRFLPIASSSTQLLGNPGGGTTSQY